MTGLETVAVIGLGLIGGSVARDLASRGARVLAADPAEASMAQAIAAGVVVHRLEPDLRGVAEADAVVVAVPVPAAASVLELLAAQPRGRIRLVTDVGSTKRSVLAAAVRAGLGDCFVGAHPMAGHHRSGWEASGGDTFRGATVYLCRTPATRDDAFEAADALWRWLGARPEPIDGAAHDARLALASHLPQAAASALGRVLAAAGIAPARLGPGGRDSTRLAGSPAALWSGIMADNADELVAGIDRLRAELAVLRDALARCDEAAARTWLEQAAEWHEGPARNLPS